MFARQIFFRIHGGEGDAAANADLVGGAAHLVGEGSAGLEKAGGAGADHGGVGGEAAGVDVLRREAALEGNEIALPHGVAQFAAALDRLQLAVQKLLRGVHVAVDQAGHGDGIRSMQGFARGGRRLRRHFPSQAMLFPVMAIAPSSMMVSAWSKHTTWQPVMSRSTLWIHGGIALLIAW